LEADPNLRSLTAFGRTRLYPGTNGRAYIEWTPSPSTEELEQWKIEVLQLFVTLITNPLWEELQGPCPTCGDYFLRKSARKRVYCSRKCGARRTAVSAVKVQRLRMQQEKIRFAKKLIAEWEGTVRRIGWKDWIAKRTLGSDLALTVHWLTRSVNNGSIKAPREGFPKIPGKTGVRVVQ